MFSLRPKTALDSSFQNYTKCVPGPGQYDVSISDPNRRGFSFVSKYRSAGGVVISRLGKRFDNTAFRNSIQVPGPGNYDHKLQFSSNGNYYISQWRNSGAPMFPKANRKVSLDNSITRKSKY